MNLLVDCRYVRHDMHDGISRFTAGVVTELAKLMPLTMLISDARQLTQLPDLPWVLGPSPTSPLEPFVARRINRMGFDTVFSPMQTMGSGGRAYRLALTVHDLIYYAHPTPPKNLPWYVRLAWRVYHLAWWPQRRLLNGSDLVVTVSQTTAGLIEEHRLTKRPVAIVHNAADPLPGAVHAGRTPPPRPLFVYMGSFMPYKNVDALVRAFELLPGAELKLLSRVDPSEERRLRQSAPNAQLHFANGVTDAEYAEALDSATALVTASRDEGFGIPLIEAGSRGTPIAVSRIPIFEEIGGDAAVFFDQEDPIAIADALRSLLDPSEWLLRSAASRRNAERYSWSHSAAELLRALATLESK